MEPNKDRPGGQNQPHIMILGVGNTLFSDDGVGIRVVEKLEKEHQFPDNVSVIDGVFSGLICSG